MMRLRRGAGSGRLKSQISNHLPCQLPAAHSTLFMLNYLSYEKQFEDALHLTCSVNGPDGSLFCAGRF
jgi:hypothetical protein